MPVLFHMVKYIRMTVFGQPFVKRFALSYQSIVLSVCDVCAMWPNGWTDQDETWHTGRPRPWPHCVRWGPSSPSPKGAQARPPIFGPYLLRPNGYMDQDVTWCMEVGLGPGDFVLDGDPAPPPQKGGRALLPNFRPISIVAKRLNASRCHLVQM